MDLSKEPLMQGLYATPKWIPCWYQYDELGSRMFERAAYDNPYYYIYKSECPVLEKHKKEMTAGTQSPYVYMDLGCGKMKKSRMLIDTMFEKQEHLIFYANDISADTLKEDCAQLGKDFGAKLSVRPVVGDFAGGFEILRNNNNDRKFISCLGGTLQILPYDHQVTFLKNLSDAMSDDDSFLLTMDITNDTDAVKKAYLGGDGKSGFTQVYRNLFHRLNREYDTNFDPDNFEFECRFTKQKETSSFATLLARSKIQQSQVSKKLPKPIELAEGECIRLSSHESYSCKYTHAQIQRLATKGGMSVEQTWQSDNGHVATVLLKKL